MFHLPNFRRINHAKRRIRMRVSSKDGRGFDTREKKKVNNSDWFGLSGGLSLHCFYKVYKPYDRI